MTRSRLIALLLALTASAAHATSVMVIALDQGRAQVIIDGSVVRELRSGQTSPEGVRLVSADRKAAVLEVEGREIALGLGQSTLATAALTADPRGQFFTTAHINGVATNAVIDTGATLVTISRDEAQRLSISLAGAPRVQISTAGGPRFGYRVNVASVRVGSITLRNVEALVTEGGGEQLQITLIGMSFLSGVDMHRVGDTLTLSRRQF